MQNNIAYDPEYVFYDIKVSNFILIFNLFDNVKFKHIFGSLWLEIFNCMIKYMKALRVSNN